LGTTTNLSFEQIQDLMKRRLKVSENTTEYELEQAVAELKMEQADQGSVDLNYFKRKIKQPLTTYLKGQFQ
jgi:hypothetical protein